MTSNKRGAKYSSSHRIGYRQHLGHSALKENNRARWHCALRIQLIFVIWHKLWKGKVTGNFVALISSAPSRSKTGSHPEAWVDEAASEAGSYPEACGSDGQDHQAGGPQNPALVEKGKKKVISKKSDVEK